MSIKKTALVLQGGAALGAYEYGVIKALDEYGIKPQIITGVSIGSFNAGVLAGAKDNDPIKSLDHLMASGSVAPLSPATVISDGEGNKNYYWDGGFFNNTPLSKAIHLLKSSEEDPSQEVERELIVAELFPRQTKQVPGNLEQVFDRIVELLASSKISLDLKLFKRTSSYMDLIQQIDEKLPRDKEGERIRNLPAYQSLINGHKKIDRCLVVTLQDTETVFGLLDFSKKSIERRIASGYDDTVLSLKNSNFLSTGR